MTPFGHDAPAQQAQAQTPATDASGERWELRTVVFADEQEKTSSNNKLYWRVKDTNNKWYSVWEPVVKANIDANYPNPTPIAVHITPSKTGGNPFYTIEAAGPGAEEIVKEGAGKVRASAAPGGKNSPFNRRMHPDDALRVTNLACQERAIQMVALTIADKPETITYEQYVKAKLVEYTNFLSSLINQPLTETPQVPEPLPTGDPGPEPAPEDTYDDIPL